MRYFGGKVNEGSGDDGSRHQGRVSRHIPIKPIALAAAALLLALGLRTIGRGQETQPATQPATAPTTRGAIPQLSTNPSANATGTTAPAEVSTATTRQPDTSPTDTTPPPRPNLTAVDPEDGQWPMAAKNYQNTRYSGLNQITTENAKNLRVAWTFSTGVNRGQEAAPIVVGSTMYVITPFPNIVYALDLAKSGAMKWKYEPNPDAASQGEACCDTINRGCVYDDGKIIFNTLDVHTYAIDAQTGKLIWKTKLGDINKGETITMSPLVVKGKVLVGNSGGELGVRGWITALDEKTGKVAWRAYSSGPDTDCLIGDRFKPFYDSDKGKDLGVKTWPPDHWKVGGGTVWGWVSYDPDTNLIFYGMSNPGCWNPELRPGDNKWSAGMFARDPETGDAIWYYQFNPHDLYDHDGVNENVVVDLPIDGKDKPLRKVLLHADRNGHMYVMDRQTGQVLSAEPFAPYITTSTGVDLKTGRLQYVDAKKPVVGKVVRDIAPAPPGGKDWQPMAYSPRTGWLYVPHQNLSCDFEGVEASYIEGTPYLGANVKMYAGPGGFRGKYMAWDPVAKKEIWNVKEDFPVWSGTLVTAGDVCVYGTMDGWFKVLDARNGNVLYTFKVSSGIIGQPTTWKGPDGKQYISILSGVGGWAGAIVSGGLDPRDPTGALGFVNAMKDLPAKTTKGGTLYVFALP